MSIFSNVAEDVLFSTVWKHGWPFLLFLLRGCRQMLCSPFPALNLCSTFINILRHCSSAKSGRESKTRLSTSIGLGVGEYHLTITCRIVTCIVVWDGKGDELSMLTRPDRLGTLLPSRFPYLSFLVSQSLGLRTFDRVESTNLSEEKNSENRKDERIRQSILVYFLRNALPLSLGISLFHRQTVSSLFQNIPIRTFGRRGAGPEFILPWTGT